MDLLNLKKRFYRQIYYQHNFWSSFHSFPCGFERHTSILRSHFVLQQGRAKGLTQTKGALKKQWWQQTERAAMGIKRSPWQRVIIH